MALKIEFKSVKPNIQSINHESIFTFIISEIDPDKILNKIQGELYSEDNLKIGELKDIPSKNISHLKLNAGGSIRNNRSNQPIEIMFSCELNKRAINHIENYRLNKKEKTKDIVFTVQLNTLMLESKIVLGNLHLDQSARGGWEGKEAFNVYYQSDNNFSSRRTNMWILSADSGPNFLDQSRSPLTPIQIRIDLMEWINNFTEYLNIGNFIVYEFPQPNKIIFSKILKARYDKAQQALGEMKKQLNYGEWKQAVIMSRPIFELFKNFEDFKKFLLKNGYTESAYIEFKKSVDGFFGLVSKFYHGLEENKTDVNPDIPVEKEDAYLVYSYSISLLHLISQKLRRNP